MTGTHDYLNILSHEALISIIKQRDAKIYDLEKQLEEEERDCESEVEELEEKIEDLEQKIETLESEILILERKVGDLAHRLNVQVSDNCQLISVLNQYEKNQ
jgi:predicted  nucleic acid-binding Zn-ribbon protein